MTQIIKVIGMEKHSEDFINIEPASHFLPEWYRLAPSKIPGSFTELQTYNPPGTNSTFKKCSPFYDAMTAGYIVFLSADIEVTKKDDGLPFIMWRTQRTLVTEHSQTQWNGFPIPKEYSLFIYKWHNQFLFKTPKKYSLLFTNPVNRFDLPFQTITGIVDTDSYELSVHFPFFIKKDFSGVIEKGTPIAQIIPIKRESWSIKKEQFVEKDAVVRSEKYLSTIKRSYKKNHWSKKEYN